MRVYWDDGKGYVNLYAMSHERRDALMVLNFAINSSVSKILASC